MKDLSKVLYDIKSIDDLGRKKTSVHSISSVVKIIVTFIYIIKVLSIKNFNMMDTIVVLLYPVLIFIIGKIPVWQILKKIILVLPMIIGISIVNLIINFSREEVYFSVLLLFKCSMCLTGSLLLIVTTGMEGLAYGLKKIRVPKILINQILLLNRYIVILIEECIRIKCAYELRTSGEKSMTIKNFGSIMGHLLLKSIDRSENIHYAMELRGFSDDLYCTYSEKIKVSDIIYFVIISGALILI